MRIHSRLLGILAVAAGLSSVAQAQGGSFGSTSPLGGNRALTSHQSWTALVTSIKCQSGGSDLSSFVGPPELAIAGGPVTFNGLWNGGYSHNFLLQLTSGVHTVEFAGFGSPVWLTTGRADQVRFRLLGDNPLNCTGNIEVATATGGGGGGGGGGNGVGGGDGGNGNYVPPTTTTPPNDLVNQPAAAPEPATMLLLASGLGGLSAMAHRRRRRQREQRGE